VPFHCTVAFWPKPLPFTVKVNAAPVATAEAGLKLVITGGGGLTVNEKAAVEITPDVTTMLTVPAPPIWVAGTDAVN